jgi:hypothetical protein
LHAPAVGHAPTVPRLPHPCDTVKSNGAARPFKPTKCKPTKRIQTRGANKTRETQTHQDGRLAAAGLVELQHVLQGVLAHHVTGGVSGGCLGGGLNGGSGGFMGGLFGGLGGAAGVGRTVSLSLSVHLSALFDNTHILSLSLYLSGCCSNKPPLTAAAAADPHACGPAPRRRTRARRRQLLYVIVFGS